MNSDAVLRTIEECIAACNACFAACLEEEDISMMRGCIRLDRECAELCGLLAAAVARNSENVSVYAEAAAKLCEACGNECDRHDHDHCKRCAKACFACLEICKTLAA